MTNLERFGLALDRKPVDRVLTWDFVDNEQILVRHAGDDKSKTYSFEQIVEMNATSFKAVGLDMTRYTYDPVNHWMGSKIVNWIRFFGVDPDNWKVEQKAAPRGLQSGPSPRSPSLRSTCRSSQSSRTSGNGSRRSINVHQARVCDRHGPPGVGGVEGPVTGYLLPTWTWSFSPRPSMTRPSS